MSGRIQVQRLLSGEHWLARRHVLWLDSVHAGEPAMSGRLILDAEVVERLTTGAVSLPRFSVDFPAEHIETDLDWDDIVLHADTLRQVREIENWIRFNEMVMGEWGMGRRVKPGYRALFHGPPGTGKTLTATLLGKVHGTTCLSDRPVQGRFEVHRRDREEPRPAVRPGSAQGLDPVLRRGRRALRQAHRRARRPRQVRQPGGRVPPPTDREPPRAGDPRNQPAWPHRRGLPAALPVRSQLPAPSTPGSLRASGPAPSPRRSPSPTTSIGGRSPAATS